ncbi:MAG: hypothetical protein ABIH29_00725, partial [Candidatus Micrarchaeota archaeon]
QKDAMEVNRALLEKHGFHNLDTLLISYVAHWLNDKEGTVRNMAELVPKGAKVVLVEEWPPLVNRSPYMSEELARKIEASILPIPLEEYFALWAKYGFVPAPEPNKFSAPIDAMHSMYSRVLIRL